MKKIYALFFTLTFITVGFNACSNDSEYSQIDTYPVAAADAISSILTNAVVIDVLLNDTAGAIPVASTVSIVGGTDTDSNGTLDNLTVTNEGTWNVNTTTGFITFTPIANYVGNPTPISYTVKNDQGNSSNEATVTITATPIVSVDIANVPYLKLSDYNFFVGNIVNQIPSLNVIPYEPASSLFTDYAKKKRFIWMPTGVTATYDGDDKILNLPVGTFLIKTFYYTTIQPGNVTKLIETRVMVRKSDGWKFYEYLWNDEQNEAFLVNAADFLNGSFKTITFTKPNNQIVTTDYRIPSDGECLACHKINDVPIPIAVKPQNLNHNYNYATGSMNQMQKLVTQGYLNTYPSNIVSTVDYRDTTQSLDLRARSYLDVNCAHCHQDQGRCDYRPIRLAFRQTSEDANVGICVTADEEISPTLQKIISPGNFTKSILHYRVNITEESQRMPLLGRTIVHEEGVQLLEQWINSLNQTCD
ncbi:hypothetical protein [Flavobacterium sp.]